MSWDEDDETGLWKVVANHEEQYSIWPAEAESPLGWREAGITGTRAECLAHIDEAWTDMRPKSLRARLDGVAAADPDPSPRETR